MGNSLGKLFVVTSFGESHGNCMGVIIDGCPAGLPISRYEIQIQLDRRKPLVSAGGTTRTEQDKVELLAGVFRGFTTGAPICALVLNKNIISDEYIKMKRFLRPGHADYTALEKYGGFNDFRGGGRFSGRVTAGFVIAGAIARRLLRILNIEIMAHTIEIGGIKARSFKLGTIKKNIIRNSLSCADSTAAKKMAEAIEEAKKEGDSLGGIIEGIAMNVPSGLGEPVFDTTDGELAKALLSIPAVKGVEFGSGFYGAGLKGSKNNDYYIIRDGKVSATSNNSGGVLGGISSGEPIILRVAIKPTPSISKKQKTVDIEKMKEVEFSVGGRHDVCIVPRAVVVVESMIAITISDLGLRAGLIPKIIK